MSTTDSKTGDAPVDLGAKSILLVDDSFVLRDRLALAFQERGFRVSVAGSYDEALTVFRQSPTDLAVLDLRMPGKPGMALIPELKKIHPDTKILILSGFGSIATAIDAIRLGPRTSCPSRLMPMTFSTPSPALDPRSKFRKPRKRSGTNFSASRMGTYPSRAGRLWGQHLRSGSPAGNPPSLFAAKASQTRTVDSVFFCQ